MRAYALATLLVVALLAAALVENIVR